MFKPSVAILLVIGIFIVAGLGVVPIQEHQNIFNCITNTFGAGTCPTTSGTAFATFHLNTLKTFAEGGLANAVSLSWFILFIFAIVCVKQNHRLIITPPHSPKFVGESIFSKKTSAVSPLLFWLSLFENSPSIA